MKGDMARAALILLLLLAGGPAWAHKPSDSYLALTVQDAHVIGRWDIALRDLDLAVGLDADDDGAVTWGEVRARQQDIAAYVLSRLILRSREAACPATATGQLIDDHTDGAYAVLRFTAACGNPIDDLAVDYRLLFELDAQHKGLLRLTRGEMTTTAIFSAESPTHRFAGGRFSLWMSAAHYVREGVWHIWMGFDHVLFLIALLLPAVLIRTGSRWEAVADFSSVWWHVLRTVTAFTVAHSLTLALATLGVVRLPSRLVESTIAASVVLAGLSNLYPILAGRRWLVAFGFGLIHGFGFAAVLADLGLPQHALLTSLISFNLGVEIGQLAIVAVFLPVAFQIRRSRPYEPVVLVAGSAAVVAVALLWLVERAFNLALLPLQ
jgi:hypothetical protein